MTEQFEGFARLDPIYLEWIDSGSQDSWMSDDEISTEMSTCKTFGLFIMTNSEQVFVALTHDDASDRVCCVMQIPLVAVTKVHRALVMT